MKVVCINTTYGNGKLLELNKVYDTVEMTERHFGYPRYGDYFIIYSEKYINNEIWVKKTNFITLDEYRSRKLNNIIK